MKKIAIPISKGKLEKHFGNCSYYKIYTVSGKGMEMHINTPEIYNQFEVARWLLEQKVTDVIAHKMDGELIDMLLKNKVNVFLGAPVEQAGDLIDSYLSGKLRTQIS